MATVRSGINKVGNNYYQSITQENSDGSVGTTFYRVDAQGNNGVPIYDVDKSAGSDELVKSFDPNATEEEQRLLSDPNSQLSQVRSQQVISSNPNANVDQQSSLSQAGGGSGNQATIDENQPGAAGGSTPTEPNTEEQQQSQSQDLRYPVDMTPAQDTIVFTAVEYIPPGLNPTGGGTGRVAAARNSQRSTKGTVTLPIQSQISDGNIVGWEQGSLDEITRKALNFATNVVKGTVGNFEESISKSITEFTNKTSQDSMLALLAEKVIGIQNLQGRTGGILNPNIELLFTGPGLREFSFNIKMSPRSKKESVQVKSIIKFFKQNMAPKRQQDNLFLKAPNTFLIKYQGAGEQGLNKIKECALLGCYVNYTPQGTYMTYEDGTMVSYFMQLSFREIEPVYDVDYKDNHPIGF